jgi:hypothetical protein
MSWNPEKTRINYPNGDMMVITKEEFEERRINPNIQRIGKNQAKLLDILRKDLSKAWSQAELQKKLHIEYMSAVNYALHALQKKGLIESKIVEGTIYWRAIDENVPGVVLEDSRDSKT